MGSRAKGILAVALVGALAWLLYSELSGISLIPGSDLPSVPEQPSFGRLTELQAVASVSPAPLLGGAPQYDLGGRNLFQYGQIKPPPPPPEEIERRRKEEEERLKALEEAARARRDEEEARRKAQEDAQRAMQELNREAQKAKTEAVPTERRKPPPPPIDLKLIGYLGPADRRIAVFYTSDGKEIVLGRKGEVIEGRFRVLEIGTESVEMGYVDPEHAGASKVIQLGS